MPIDPIAVADGRVEDVHAVVGPAVLQVDHVHVLPVVVGEDLHAGPTEMMKLPEYLHPRDAAGRHC